MSRPGTIRDVNKPTNIEAMKTQFDHFNTFRTEVIEPQGLTTIRSNHNGRNVVDFQTYKQAEEFVSNYGGEICLFSKKDGQFTYHNHGRKYEPLTVDDYVKDLGDNYRTYAMGDDDDYRANILLAAAGGLEYDLLSKLSHLYKKIDENAAMCEENEVVIIHNEMYFDTVEREMMAYYHDGQTWIVGVDMSDVKFFADLCRDVNLPRSVNVPTINQ